MLIYFGQKYWTPEHLLSSITMKKETQQYLHNFTFLHDSEWGSTGLDNFILSIQITLELLARSAIKLKASS